MSSYSTIYSSKAIHQSSKQYQHWTSLSFKFKTSTTKIYFIWFTIISKPKVWKGCKESLDSIML